MQNQEYTAMTFAEASNSKTFLGTEKMEIRKDVTMCIQRELWFARLVLTMLVVFLFVLCPDRAAAEKETRTSAQKCRSELMIFEEIPIVTIASRREQIITEVPSATSVITSEDIRYSGATNLAELFRSVPGIDVMAMSVSDYDVCPRGLNIPGVKNMLVLLNGRSVYLDFYGIVAWDMIPVPLEDIKRIEIIRGPGSALYGANAHSGVINILTKSVEESCGTLVRTGIGEGNSRMSSFIHAGQQSDLGYKLSLKWIEANEWSGDEKGLESLAGTVLAEYTIRDASRLSVSAGMVDSPTGETVTGIGPFERDGTTTHLKLNYDLSAFKAQCFWNKLDVDTVYQGANYPILTNTYDFEAQHVFPFGERYSITCGGSCRHNTVESALMDKDHSQDLWAMYLHGETLATEKLIMSLGTRYDSHSLVGGQLSPRAGIIYTPVEKHTFRISCGRAFKNPTFIQSYLYIPSAYAHGNEKLEPEELMAYELGYQTFITRKVKARLDLFLNEYKDFIKFDNYSTTDIPDYTYMNIGEAEGIGGEIAFDFLFSEGLAGVLSYSYQEITNKQTEERIKSVPKHKLTAGIRGGMGNGYHASLMAHYVEGTSWEAMGADIGNVDSYTLVNVRIARDFLNDKVEVAVTGYNLLNDKHREHPWGEEIGRRFYLTICYSF